MKLFLDGPLTWLWVLQEQQREATRDNAALWPVRPAQRGGEPREVAFTFFRLDGGVSSYRVARRKFAPPEAYEAMKGQIVDFVLTEAEVMACVEKADRRRG